MTSRGRSRCLGLAAALAAGAALLVACDRLDPSPSFERMINQQKYKPYRASEYFADGRVMRTPPEGTIARSRRTGDPEVTGGLVNGDYVRRIPVPLSRDFMREGKRHFDSYCAPCHGVRGNGVSRVASSMSLRRPPSLIDAAGRSLPPGRVYRAITEGYGLMRSYTEDLITPEERWSVVAYIVALQRSQEVPLASLPPDVQERALEVLP